MNVSGLCEVAKSGLEKKAVLWGFVNGKFPTLSGLIFSRRIVKITSIENSISMDVLKAH